MRQARLTLALALAAVLLWLGSLASIGGPLSSKPASHFAPQTVAVQRFESGSAASAAAKSTPADPVAQSTPADPNERRAEPIAPLLPELAGHVSTGPDRGAAVSAPLSIAPSHLCAPPPDGRLTWKEVRREGLLPRRPCNATSRAAAELALCSLAEAVAGGRGELLLVYGSASTAAGLAALNRTTTSAARALGGRRLLLLASGPAAARVGGDAGVPTFSADRPADGAGGDVTAPLAAAALLRAGMRVVLSSGGGGSGGGGGGSTDVSSREREWRSSAAGLRVGLQGHGQMLLIRSTPSLVVKPIVSDMAPGVGASGHFLPREESPMPADEMARREAMTTQSQQRITTHQ
mmetsp:Transcript_3998/g.12895  ORF Transcript_3998/g.12895 Transcript_3998/m.12895 type:complete len:349 (+) Transcript_3998:17-1063(+)